MFRRRRDLTGALDAPAQVEWSAARRMDVWCPDVVVISRRNHVAELERRAHERIVCLHAVFAHSNERLRIVRVPEKARLAKKPGRTKSPLVRKFCMMGEVLEIRILRAVTLVRAGSVAHAERELALPCALRNAERDGLVLDALPMTSTSPDTILNTLNTNIRLQNLYCESTCKVPKSSEKFRRE